MANYEIKQAVRGAFSGRGGRVSYDLPAGIVSAAQIAPEALERLIEKGIAVKARAVKTDETGVTE